jgi:hypothetical protein
MLLREIEVVTEFHRKSRPEIRIMVDHMSAKGMETRTPQWTEVDHDTVNKVLSKVTIGEFQNTSNADIKSLTVATVDMNMKKANVQLMENSAENVEKEIIMHEFARTQEDV